MTLGLEELMLLRHFSTNRDCIGMRESDRLVVVVVALFQSPRWLKLTECGLRDKNRLEFAVVVMVELFEG